jgi:hypothetical protein
MLHHRDNPICASPLALRSELGRRCFGEGAATFCEMISALRFGRERRPRRPLLSLQGG